MDIYGPQSSELENAREPWGKPASAWLYVKKSMGKIHGVIDFPLG